MQVQSRHFMKVKMHMILQVREISQMHITQKKKLVMKSVRFVHVSNRHDHGGLDQSTRIS